MTSSRSHYDQHPGRRPAPRCRVGAENLVTGADQHLRGRTTSQSRSTTTLWVPETRRVLRGWAVHGRMVVGRLPREGPPMMVNQDGTPYIDDPPSPRVLGQRDAQRGRPSPPLYDSRAEACDYATGWYEHSARPAPDTLHPRWRWVRLQRMWITHRRHPRRSRRCRWRHAVDGFVGGEDQVVDLGGGSRWARASSPSVG
jgi:hypothetical protein